MVALLTIPGIGTEVAETTATLHPLPSNPVRLEFGLVGQIKTSEISDYAIVYGENIRHLTIRSLFNFNYQTIPIVRRITIMADTLALFLEACKANKRVMNFRCCHYLISFTFLSIALRPSSRPGRGHFFFVITEI